MRIYTAIISDLHLCEAEPIHPKYPLWKKFKTREFFFDEIFHDFLIHLEKKSEGKKIELVLNGDIFDFDSVTSIPDQASFRVSYLEKKRGLRPAPERSEYKVSRILKDHELFISSMSEFIKKGNEVIFIIGNHDLEFHFPNVQNKIRESLNLTDQQQNQLRFVEWFYISEKDTLIEHGNQYDPYCVCEDPINPFTQGYNYKSMRLPFGNLACRYLMNGMGFFNPHVDSNYIMSLGAYIKFFLKYMIRAQPELMMTWLLGSVLTLWGTFRDRLDKSIRDPLRIETRINEIAEKAKAEPRMVRELRELFATSAAENPFLIARELWLDRAFLIFIGFFIIFQLMLFVKQLFEISFFWAFVPLLILLPFYLFYSKSIISRVSSYKEPDEQILSMAGSIVRVTRIVFGHTHQARHEIIGAIEHLNSGTWSPAFLDVECTKSLDQKTYVWISPDRDESKGRVASLLSFKNGKSEEFISKRGDLLRRS